ncbi:hypothetical protein [Micromonospora sp. NPDC005206]|uniref:hypothetical protein n=1 Tax=Micromonospora sp. NPDC005206 TaxID=3157022 RepID=UPI0033ABC610
MAHAEANRLVIEDPLAFLLAVVSARGSPLSAPAAAQPCTMEAVADAPRAPGVHVVLRSGVVIYVGLTGRMLRSACGST